MNANRKEVIEMLAAALSTLESPRNRRVSGGYADLTRQEGSAIKAMLGPEGQVLFSDVADRFLAAVKLRCTAAVLKSVEDTYYYWREELAERAAS